MATRIELDLGKAITDAQLRLLELIDSVNLPGYAVQEISDTVSDLSKATKAIQ